MFSLYSSIQSVDVYFPNVIRAIKRTTIIFLWLDVLHGYGPDNKNEKKVCGV